MTDTEKSFCAKKVYGLPQRSIHLFNFIPPLMDMHDLLQRPVQESSSFSLPQRRKRSMYSISSSRELTFSF